MRRCGLSISRLMVRRSISIRSRPRKRLRNSSQSGRSSTPVCRQVHLPELMMAIDSEIRFSWILLGREPADDQELLYVYAALLGHAMDLTAQRVSLLTPGLSVGGLTSALQLLEDGQTMRRTGADRGRSEYTPHCGQMRIQKRHF